MHNYPNEINNLIAGLNRVEITDFHVSGDTVFIIDNKYVLKVSKNLDRLNKEFEKDEWFNKILPTPKPIKFIIEDKVAYYLREYLDGENLCSSKYLSRPLVLIKLLKEALNMFHSKDTKGCPFIVGNGDSLIHGDFCLPNILVKDDQVVGFVDIGDAGVGDIWYDYAWCIWSFEYNLGTKEYTKYLLDELKIEFDKEKFIIY